MDTAASVRARGARAAGGLTPRQRRQLLRIFAAACVMAAGLLLPIAGIPRAAVLLAAYALIGWDTLWGALRGIARGRVFDENFLMAVATVGAVALGDYTEAVAVMLFYQLGEWFQRYAVGRSRRSIAALMDIRPDHANLREADGGLREVAPEDVAAGDLIVIKAGERVPLDGTVEEGASALDTSALTGESAPRDVAAGDEVMSGCINLTGVLFVRVSRPYGESTVARILQLVESSGSRKARSEQFITRFARRYTPAVCGAAVLLAALPPLLLQMPFADSLNRALTFLVISCPCALVISIPLSFFGGIGGASRRGVLVKGGNFIEALSRVDTVVFDKTGTLTAGRFAVAGVFPRAGLEEGELLRLAAHAEHYSTHPIARSVEEAYGEAVDTARVAGAGEVPGRGVRAEVDGRQVLAGNARMMAGNGVDCGEDTRGGTVVHVAVDGAYAGFLAVEDAVKPDAARAVQGLRRLGVRRTVMLTGDGEAAGKKVAAQVGIDELCAQMLPQHKVERVERLMAEKPARGTLVFVGDGVNDAPVLARADVGVAMGALGADAAIEAADVVIMNDEPCKLTEAVRLARRTMNIVRQNIVFALGIKAVVMLLGALGRADMWAAVFSDVGVMVLAILNAMRALSAK